MLLFWATPLTEPASRSAARETRIRFKVIN